MKLDIRKFILPLLIILTLFTNIRNLTSLYYVIVILIIIYFNLGLISKYFLFQREKLLLNLFLYFTIFICAWSFLFINNEVRSAIFTTDNLYDVLFYDNNIIYNNIIVNPLVGIPRLLLMPSIAFIFLYTLTNTNDFLKIIRIILLCYIIAALGIIYQVYYAENISWFADSHNRGGYIRYSSILGSLTVFGSITGYVVLILLNNKIIKNKLLIPFCLMVVFSAAIISLTKTGVILIILAIFFYLIYFALTNFKEFYKLFIFLIAMLILIIITIYNNEYLLNYVNTVLNFTFGENFTFNKDSNVSLINDTPGISVEYLISRLTKYTFGAILYYGNHIFLLGVGVWGGAGVLGYPDGASPHSGLIDLLLIGGPIYLSLFLYMYIKIQVYFFYNIKDNLNSMFFLLNILFFLNMLFISGSLFQPAISMPFWLSVAYYTFLNQNFKSMSK